MNPQLANANETEEARRESIDELEADFGTNWADAFRPGTVGCHELLDRTAMLMETLERFVQSHPACVQNAEWYALAEQAAVALRELYQRVGSEHLTKD